MIEIILILEGVLIGMSLSILLTINDNGEIGDRYTYFYTFVLLISIIGANALLLIK